MKRQLTLLKRPLKFTATNCTAGGHSSQLSTSLRQLSTSASRSESSSRTVEDERDENNDWHDLNTVMRARLAGGGNHCHSCGRPIKSVPTINVNNRFMHCYDCNMFFATSSGDSSQRNDVLKPTEQFIRRPPYPSEIAAYLDKYVIGQDEAKRTLSVGVYSHYRRLACNAEQQRLAQSFLTVHCAPSTMGPGSGVPHGILHSSIANATGQSDFAAVQHQQQQRSSIFGFRNIPDDDEQIRLDKSNILLLGPSGVGKTFVTQILAKILDVPIALGDCTSMTQAGYVGEDVESVLQKLLVSAQNDVERAQRGIVFLDEVDKIAATAESSAHSYRDVSGEGVQHALLKLVEGTVANVKSDKKGPNGQQSVVPIDTTDILFIASGAFTGLEKIVGRRLDKRTVGFGSANLANSITVDDKEQQVINEKRDKLIAKADQGDIIKFGMIPEMVGRFPILVPFHSLNKEMLVRVLTEPRNSILAQMKVHFAMDNVALEFAESALEEIAQMALERKTGARALRSIVEKVLLLAKYEVPGSDIDSIRVSRECVRGEAPYEYTRHPSEPVPVAAAGGA